MISVQTLKACGGTDSTAALILNLTLGGGE
jgi:hypothetical protein